jgi:hypothetical protein
MVWQVRPAYTRVISEGWTAQLLYAVGQVVQIACTTGNAFFNQTSFSATKNLMCANDGSWIEQNFAGRACVKTCSVPNSDHDRSLAVTVGTTMTAKCKEGYHVEATGQGLSFSLCTNSQTLQASCQQTSPAGSARLDFECMKVTCGTFKTYPLSEVTISPAQNSRFSDYNDENGNEAERTRVDCGEMF